MPGPNGWANAASHKQALSSSRRPRVSPGGLLLRPAQRLFALLNGVRPARCAARRTNARSDRCAGAHITVNARKATFRCHRQLRSPLHPGARMQCMDRRTLRHPWRRYSGAVSQPSLHLGSCSNVGAIVSRCSTPCICQPRGAEIRLFDRLPWSPLRARPTRQLALGAAQQGLQERSSQQNPVPKCPPAVRRIRVSSAVPADIHDPRGRVRHQPRGRSREDPQRSTAGRRQAWCGALAATTAPGGVGFQMGDGDVSPANGDTGGLLCHTCRVRRVPGGLGSLRRPRGLPAIAPRSLDEMGRQRSR